MIIPVTLHQAWVLTLSDEVEIKPVPKNEVLITIYGVHKTEIVGKRDKDITNK